MNSQGKEESLLPEQFYKEHYATVYAYLLSLCGDPFLAEDLASETFLRALKHIDSYDPRYAPTTWLCTIGKNLLYTHYKREKRHLPLEEYLPIVAPSPESLYLQKEQEEELRQAAKALSPVQRQVLYMRLEGLSFRQIGEALNHSESWARVTFFRAKNQIIAEMEGKP